MHRNVVGNNERKTPLGRPRQRWQSNIKMDLKEIMCDGVVEWI
jgi:hypothetical protein